MMDQFSTHSSGGRCWLLIEATDYPLKAWYVIKELR
jgi:hypothetical protein